jgi:replication fork protection complex subunit Tof1/Swi1
LIFWFLSAESARKSQKRPQSQPAQATLEENTFAHIAAVLDQETFVLLTRQMQRCYDDKTWSDLQAILLTFTQILQTVQAMAESNDEEDQEIAENIQNRIFYEEATHDLLVSVLRTYKTQSFSYLDAITECVHVFVRMLERYSKQNGDLQIRSKRRARRRQKDSAQTSGQTLDDND